MKLRQNELGCNNSAVHINVTNNEYFLCMNCVGRMFKETFMEIKLKTENMQKHEQLFSPTFSEVHSAYKVQVTQKACSRVRRDTSKII
jgi:hypothetical protein